MKTNKILLSLTLFLLMIFAFTVFSYAEPQITVSDDFSFVIYGGEKYVRVSKADDDVTFRGSCDYFDSYDIDFITEHDKDIDYGAVWVYENAISLHLDFKSGGFSYMYYVREEHLDEYNLVAEGKSPYIEFYYHDLKVTREKIFGEMVDLDPVECLISYSLDVFNTDESGNLSCEMGLLIYIGDNCYYVDYSENNSSYNTFDFLNYESIAAHKVTDEEIVVLYSKPVESEPDRYYVDSGVFLMFVVFLILPTAVIAFCIFRIMKENKEYKTLFKIIITIAALLILIAIILGIIALPYI